ncbi:MAG: hypothetical protein HYV97_18435 [Bdellovibrio sp.]|nr:hypothetical protein [Bdellovibrio sp.]
MKKNIVILGMSFFFLTHALGATTAYLLPTAYTTLPSTQPLIPYGNVQLGSLNGVVGFSFSIPDQNIIEVPGGEIEFQAPQQFAPFPIPGGGVGQILTVNPASFWKADFPGFRMPMPPNQGLVKGCKTYVLNMNKPYQVSVQPPQGIQFAGLETNLPNPPMQKTYFLQNSNLILQTVPMTEVRLNICHYPDDPDDGGIHGTTCAPMVTDYVRLLTKKTLFGPFLPSVLTGVASAGASAGAVYLMAENLPIWLINLLGREVIKQPLLAMAPMAGAVGIAVAASTFIGYEAIVLTKLIRAGQVLKSIKMAANGAAEKSWVRSLEKRIDWDPKLDFKKKEATLASAIKRLDTEGLLCNGELGGKKVKKNPKLRDLIASKREIINYLSKNTHYLLSN